MIRACHRKCASRSGAVRRGVNDNDALDTDERNPHNAECRGSSYGKVSKIIQHEAVVTARTIIPPYCRLFIYPLFAVFDGGTVEHRKD